VAAGDERVTAVGLSNGGLVGPVDGVWVGSSVG